MSAMDRIGAAPEARQPRFLWLMFGCTAAPTFWIVQVMLSYMVTAMACYPGDRPLVSAPGSLFTMLAVFDAVALVASFAGGAVSLLAWLRTHGDNHARLLALWGLMSSLWFFFAILFNTIASVLAPLCGE